jgi:hypothetical protein
MKETLAHNLAQLRGRIAQACDDNDRDADDITIVAVTKTQPPQAIMTAVAVGLHDIGESRIQESAPKIETTGHIARFHMIGHLQTNKVKTAVELFDVIHSVDSLKLAEEINRQASRQEHSIDCLIQVNCSGESQKFGVTPDACLDLVTRVNQLEHIKVTGLMTIAPFSDDETIVRAAFAQGRELFKRGRDLVGDGFDELSMGMTGDFELAIAEGATIIRIGTLLFGPRLF